MWATIGLVLAATVVSLVLIGLLLVLYVRWLITRKLKHVQAMGTAQQGEPARITMELKPLNFSDPQVRVVMQQLKALGYASAGRYLVPEMAGLKLWAGTHPQDGSLALVFESGDQYFAADVIRFYEGGAVLGAGTNPVFDPAQYPSHLQYQQFPPQTPMQEVVQWVKAQPLQSAVVPATVQSLRSLNIKMYADLMDYQLSLPLPSLAEWKESIQKSASALGSPVPPLARQQWQTFYDLQQEITESTAEEAMRDHVLRSGVVPALEWDRMQHNLVFVHERLNTAAVTERALRRSEWTQEQPAIEALVRQNLGGVALFEAIQDLLPEDERFVYLTHVGKPLDARAYKPVSYY
ncbi:MAG: hypothetical protein RSD57_12965 [Comamonas sp.]